MICNKCGNEADSGKFCVNCGAPTVAAATTIVETAVAPPTPTPQAN